MKLVRVRDNVAHKLSHPARGAWIETKRKWRVYQRNKSHPARGAWIETKNTGIKLYQRQVAPRKGGVD